MIAMGSAVQERREVLASELADAALQAVARQGVRAPSVDLEIGLWKALGHTLGRLEAEAPPTADGCEQRVASLARAAYETALSGGIRGSFLDLELGIWNAVRQVVRRQRGVCSNPC